VFYTKNLRTLGKNDKGAVWPMIAVDGVVGVGKSTLMDILVNERGLIPFEEPVMNNPILDKFYYDRKRYSFSLQVFFLNERFKHIKKASSITDAVLDRSIYGDLIFAKMLKDGGDMTEEEFLIYLDLFHNMIEHCKPPKLMVYLEVSPEEAMRRIAKRGRDYELATEQEYWINLNKEYQAYFEQYDHSPVLKVNVDQLNFESNADDKAYLLNLIDQALEKVNTIDHPMPETIL